MCVIILCASFIMSAYSLGNVMEGKSILGKLQYQYEKNYLYNREFEKQKDYKDFPLDEIHLKRLDNEIENALIYYEFEYGLEYRYSVEKALGDVSSYHNVELSANEYKITKKDGTYIVLLNIVHESDDSKVLRRRYDIKETTFEKKRENLDKEKREKLVNKIAVELKNYKKLNNIIDETDVEIALSSIVKQYELILEEIEINKNKEKIEILIRMGHKKYTGFISYIFYVDNDEILK